MTRVAEAVVGVYDSRTPAPLAPGVVDGVTDLDLAEEEHLSHGGSRRHSRRTVWAVAGATAASILVLAVHARAAAPDTEQQPAPQVVAESTPGVPGSDGFAHLTQLSALGLARSDVPDLTVQPVTSHLLPVASLDLCAGQFASEKHRGARQLRTAVDASTGTPIVQTDVVRYDDIAAANQAWDELAWAAGTCLQSAPTIAMITHADDYWPYSVPGVDRLAYSLHTTKPELGPLTAIYLRRANVITALVVFPAREQATSIRGMSLLSDIAAVFEQRLSLIPSTGLDGTHQ